MFQSLSKKMGLKNAYCEKDKDIYLDQNELRKAALKNKKWLDMVGIKI